MGSNTTTTQQQSAPSPYLREPYAPLAPYLSDIMGISSNLYNNGAGTALWGGGANAPLTPEMQSAMGGLSGFANNTTGQAAQPFNTALQGITNPQGWLNNVAAISGGAQSVGPDQFNYLYNLGLTQNQPVASAAMAGATSPTAAQTYLTDMASGTNQANPYLQQLLDTNAQRIANLAQSASSGAGRYGSFGMYDALNRSIAATNNPLLFQSAENERQRQLAATGQIDAARQAQINEMLGVGNLNNQSLQGALGAAQGSANVQNMNIQNMLNASQLGLNNSLGWANAAPNLYNLAQAPYQTQLGLGSYLQNRAQNEQQLAMQQFQQANMMPWTQLGLYGNTFTQLAPLLSQYGSGFSSSPNTTTTTSQPTPWTTFAGLGIAGGGLAGQLGAFGPAAQAALTGASFLSDARTKTDIEHIGVDPATGLNLYAFRYANDPKHYPKIVGPMAQEVAEKYPHMVGRTDTGALYIKV